MRRCPWAWGLVWWALGPWGPTAWAEGEPVTLTPFRQGIRLDQPWLEPLDWTAEVDHRPGWDFGRRTLTSQGRVFAGPRWDQDLGAEAGVLVRGLERWHPLEGLAQGGVRAAVWGRGPVDWNLEVTSIVFGEAAGLWTLDAGVGAEQPTQAGAWVAQVTAHVANRASELAPVFSPFGGLLEGQGEGLWTLAVGHRFTVYESPGEWRLGWALTPRVVAAGWQNGGAPAGGLGGVSNLSLGKWSVGLELEATFDPLRGLWFGKVGFATP